MLFRINNQQFTDRLGTKNQIIITQRHEIEIHLYNRKYMVFILTELGFPIKKGEK